MEYKFLKLNFPDLCTELFYSDYSSSIRIKPSETALQINAAKEIFEEFCIYGTVLFIQTSTLLQLKSHVLLSR